MLNARIASQFVSHKLWYADPPDGGRQAFLLREATRFVI